MKKFYRIVLNILPFFVWTGYFYCALKAYFVPGLALIQIFLLLGLPLLYSLLNGIFSSSKKEFLTYNLVFGVSQVVGYYIAGALYYNNISSDSGTIQITNAFSVLSIIYILVLSLNFYGFNSTTRN